MKNAVIFRKWMKVSLEIPLDFFEMKINTLFLEFN